MLHWTDEPPAGNDAAQVRGDFACLIERALTERAAGLGTLPERLGLAPEQLAELRATWFEDRDLPDLDAPVPARTDDQNAVALLLLWRGGRNTPEVQWMAAIVARRALEQNHLWQDLGLPDRVSLSRLMKRYFPRLAAANVNNMRWKKFFYRQICSDSDFALCLSPRCEDCADKDECFAPDEL